MTTMLNTAALTAAVSEHPSWCDPAECAATVHGDGSVETLHSTRGIVLPGTDDYTVRATYFTASDQETDDGVRIYSDDYPHDDMTPAEARALAAALVAVADLVDPEGAR